MSVASIPVRIFVLANQRRDWLERTMHGLIAQTHANWVCEVRGDDPENTEIPTWLDGLQDSRISYLPNEVPGGVVANFNLCLRKISEPYAAFLQEGGWWEPRFLERLLTVIEGFPESDVVWANTRVWTQDRAGEWIGATDSVWQTRKIRRPIELAWPVAAQIFGALHSQNAMLIRREAIWTARLPADTPPAVMEAIRERAFSGRLLFVPDLLANAHREVLHPRFTNGQDRRLALVTLGQAFFQNVAVSDEAMAEIWQECRAGSDGLSRILFRVLLSRARLWRHLKHARPADWIHFLLGATLHPVTTWRLLRRSKEPLRWMTFIEEESKARRQDASRRGFARLNPGSLFRKEI